MALIDVEAGVGRLGHRASVRRRGAGMRHGSESEPQRGLEGPGRRRGQYSLASRARRQLVLVCGRPRETREWGRLLLAAFFACLVVVLVGLFGLPGAGSAVPSSRTVVVRVAAGDTLWSLARRFAPQDDPRSVVRRIVELNSLDGANLQVGQSLAVPVDAD